MSRAFLALAFLLGGSAQNVMAVADGSGSVTARYRYRAFGERINLSGGAPDRHDPSFQNRTCDAGLGIYDYRNRSFDPATGRFLQRDPVDGDDLFNPYVFPGNNPVTNADPYGDWDKEGMLQAFIERYGEQGLALLVFAHQHGYKDILHAERTHVFSVPPQQVHLGGQGYVGTGGAILIGQKSALTVGVEEGGEAVPLSEYFQAPRAAVVSDPGCLLAVVTPRQGPREIATLEWEKTNEEAADLLYDELKNIFGQFEARRREMKESQLILEAYGQGMRGYLTHIAIHGFKGFGVRGIYEGWVGEELLAEFKLTPGQSFFRIAFGTVELALTATTAGKGLVKLAGKVIPKTAPGLLAQEVGRSAEAQAIAMLRKKGYTDIVQIKNVSGQGIDVAARNRLRHLRFFEIKGHLETGVARLAPEQRDIVHFVSSRLSRAVAGEGVWGTLAPEARVAAKGMLAELGSGVPRGAVINVERARSLFPRISVRRW